MSTTPTADIAEAVLSWLIRRQESRGLSGRDMAGLLGMREQEWSRIKNGHRPLGPLQRERACLAFPELTEILYGERLAAVSATTAALNDILQRAEAANANYRRHVDETCDAECSRGGQCREALHLKFEASMADSRLERIKVAS